MPFGGTNSADDFETGTRAAAIGGTTTIVDFAIQARGTKMRTALDTWWKKAEGKACIDYGLHMIVTDLGDAGLEDMDDMVREGVASFKLFMAYPNVLMVDDATIFKAHAADGEERRADLHARRERLSDRCDRAAGAGRGQDRAHLSRADAPDRGRGRGGASRDCDGGDGRRSGLHRASLERRRARTRCARRATAACPRLPRPARSTCCSRSKTTWTDKGWEGAKYVFTPPLREKRNQPKLWEGLRKDNLQVVSTDHCPFCFEDQKALGKNDFTKIPNGGPGIENRLQLLHHHGVGQGNFSINRFVELVSTAPARIFGMYPKKGVLAAGSDADLVLWDPAARSHHLRRDASHARRLLDV